MRGLLVLFCICGCAVDHIQFQGGSPEADASLDTQGDSAERQDGGPDSGEPDSDVGPARDMGVPTVDTGIADAGGVTPTDAGDASPRDAGDDAGPRDAGDDMGPRDAGDDAPDPCLGLPDADSDGITDACDRWPCGPEPTVSSPATGEGITFTGVNLGGTGGAHAVVLAGSTLAISFEWELNDIGCPGCVDFIEVGRVPGVRGPCIAGRHVGTGSGSVDSTLDGFATVDGEPFEVDLRFNLRQDYSCGSEWWRDNTPPPAEQTFATVCVVDEL